MSFFFPLSKSRRNFRTCIRRRNNIRRLKETCCFIFSCRVPHAGPLQPPPTRTARRAVPCRSSRAPRAALLQPPSAPRHLSHPETRRHSHLRCLGTRACPRRVRAGRVSEHGRGDMVEFRRREGPRGHGREAHSEGSGETPISSSLCFFGKGTCLISSSLREHDMHSWILSIDKQVECSEFVHE